jgi:hypothetical protein
LPVDAVSGLTLTALSERWSSEQGFDLTVSKYPNVPLASKRRFGVKKDNKINWSGFGRNTSCYSLTLYPSFILGVSEIQDALNIS